MDHAALQKTSERLLEAAGTIFAERGFRAATVREICEKAGANVAAVNYHFGDKEALYAAVLKRSHRAAEVKHPSDPGLGPRAPAEIRLEAFIEAFLRRIFDPSERAWLSRLTFRELLDPTAALDSLVEEEFRPRARLLGSIVRELVGKGATEDEVRMASVSIVAQCLFLQFGRPVIARLFPEIDYRPEQLQRLADHIAAFSLRALGKAPPRRRRGRKARRKELRR
jgi:AcrR family transcriptional regulator